jgi:hypothetical protein
LDDSAGLRFLLAAAQERFFKDLPEPQKLACDTCCRSPPSSSAYFKWTSQDKHRRNTPVFAKVFKPCPVSAFAFSLAPGAKQNDENRIETN